MKGFWITLLVFVFAKACSICGITEVWLLVPDVPKLYESHWRDAYAEYLSEYCETVIMEKNVRGGRADIVTCFHAVEIDRASKWHEAVGQSLHYSNELGKKPMIALFDYEKLSAPKRAALEELVVKHHIELVILKASRPEPAQANEAQLAESENCEAAQGQNVKTVQEVQEAQEPQDPNKAQET